MNVVPSNNPYGQQPPLLEAVGGVGTQQGAPSPHLTQPTPHAQTPQAQPSSIPSAPPAIPDQQQYQYQQQPSYPSAPPAPQHHENLAVSELLNPAPSPSGVPLPPASLPSPIHPPAQIPQATYLPPSQPGGQLAPQPQYNNQYASASASPAPSPAPVTAPAPHSAPYAQPSPQPHSPMDQSGGPPAPPQPYLPPGATTSTYPPQPYPNPSEQSQPYQQPSQSYHHPQQQQQHIPPPPSDVHPQHPLAPPPNPFPSAYPTQHQPQYDPPHQQFPSSSSGSLKRDSPFEEGPVGGRPDPYGNPYGEQPPPKKSKTDEASPAPFTAAQQKFFLGQVRNLKKMKEAFAFLAPVDYMAMGLPHYPSIVSHPMDLTTAEYKLNASGPKAKGRSDKGKYENREEAITDIRRVWNNSIKFNGADHLVSLSGRELEKVFEKNLHLMPKDDEPNARPMNGSAPRRNSNDDGRKKREIRPPAPPQNTWDPALGGASSRRKSGGGRKKGDEQMKYIKKALDDLFTKKAYYEFSYPFQNPVDYVALGLPDYPKVIKRPMDLGTVRANLANGYYDEPTDVNADMKLMFKNCYTYNPPGNPVHNAGKQLQAVWEEKWRAMPPKEESDVEDESEDDDEIARLVDERDRLSKRIEDLRAKRANKKKSHKAKAVAPAAPRPPKPAPAPRPPKPAPVAVPPAAYQPPKPKKQASGSTAIGGGGKGKGAGGGGKKKKDDSDDEELQASVTMAQKQELAEKIQEADGEILNKAIALIQASMPLGDNSDEIELDIESLPPATVIKLYNLVVRGPKKAKREKTGKNKHGTGGLARKSMNEEVEAEKIRMLEAKLGAFEQPAPSSSSAPLMPQASGGGSDSESGSDSASDSE